MHYPCSKQLEIRMGLEIISIEMNPGVTRKTKIACVYEVARREVDL